jgi:hypothetical protein
VRMSSAGTVPKFTPTCASCKPGWKSMTSEQKAHLTSRFVQAWRSFVCLVEWGDVAQQFFKAIQQLRWLWWPSVSNHIACSCSCFDSGLRVRKRRSCRCYCTFDADSNISSHNMGILSGKSL